MGVFITTDDYSITTSLGEVHREAIINIFGSYMIYDDLIKATKNDYIDLMHVFIKDETVENNVIIYMDDKLVYENNHKKIFHIVYSLDMLEYDLTSDDEEEESEEEEIEVEAIMIDEVEYNIAVGGDDVYDAEDNELLGTYDRHLKEWTDLSSTGQYRLKQA